MIDQARPPRSDAPVAIPEAEGRAIPQSVYETLRRRIVNVELPPGTALSRKDLAAEFGVSLMPIREALQQLEQDGLVRIRPQSGTVVTRIDQAQLRENQFLRMAVEIEVVRSLAQTPDADALDRAQAVVDMQAVLVGDVSRMDMFLDLDRAFHRTLFEGVGMGRLHAMVGRRQGHLARCQRLELPRAGKMQDIVAAHREILRAIRSRDPEAAAAAMRRHLTGTIQRVESLRLEHPGYFTGPDV
ncbi:GntR family transcriptional regulator [Maliponia aquimaris]|uniref:Putative HTH-type transcriptional regulator YdfH n=1 Tax=Maliponia aquimaris TaxID=1673631 RepID=A0A238L627_9RHOB|nr:GntR family transcriptional regulator [Maliponia aquimaris]SMX50438.1 putative HTH-type transcriptional regulator YdfH [Maliponia aquimaris]